MRLREDFFGFHLLPTLCRYAAKDFNIGLFLTFRPSRASKFLFFVFYRHIGPLGLLILQCLCLTFSRSRVLTFLLSYPLTFLLSVLSPIFTPRSCMRIFSLPLAPCFCLCQYKRTTGTLVKKPNAPPATGNALS